MRTVGGGDTAQPVSTLTDLTDVFRVKVADSVGTLIDLTAFAVSVEYDESAEEIVAAATVIFRRMEGVNSLAPLMTANPPVALGRLITFAVNPGGGTYREVFRGRITDVDWPERFGDVTVQCLDQAGVAGRTWIETARAYGSTTGVSLETVMQAVANDNLAAPAPTLYFPAASSAVVQHLVGDPPYGPTEQPTLDALRALAEAIGWTIRWRNFDANPADWRWTVFGPSRGKTVPDYTFSPADYWNVTQIRQSDVDIRNVVEVAYISDGGAVESVIVSNSASITKYGRLYIKISEGSDSPVNNATLATALANAALSDLKEPDALVEIACRYFWPGEIGVDLYRFSANGKHFSSDQDLAVMAFRHRIAVNERPTTYVLARGKPSAGVLMWRRRPSTPLTGTPSSAEIVLETVSETSLQRTYRVTKGAAVDSVWVGIVEFDSPLPSSPWDAVSEATAPLAVGVDTFTVNRPFGKRVTFIQVEPRASDLTLTGRVWQATLEAAPPQAPVWEVQARENGEVGTLFFKVQTRGEVIVSRSVQVKVGNEEPFAFVAPTRGPGDYSYVKERTLEADESEHDTRLDQSRLTRVQPRVVLESGEIMTAEPVYFDRDTRPDILFADGSGSIATVIGDTDTKSVRLERVDSSGNALGWELWIDGPSIRADVQRQGGIGGTSPMGSGVTWRIRATAYSRSSTDPDVLASSSDVEYLTVAGSAATPPRWDYVNVAAPEDGSIVVPLKMDADSNSGLTTRVRARYKEGGFWVDAGDITSQLSPIPGAPPLTQTQYTWSGMPAGFTRTGSGGNALQVELELTFEILSGSDVVASAKRSAIWHYAGVTGPGWEAPLPPPTTWPGAEPDPEWDAVTLAGPASNGLKNVTIGLDASIAEGTVELSARWDDGYGWTSRDITAEVTPALSTPPAALTSYNWNGLSSMYEKQTSGSPIVFELTSRIRKNGLIVATDTRSVHWAYTDTRI